MGMCDIIFSVVQNLNMRQIHEMIFVLHKNPTKTMQVTKHDFIFTGQNQRHERIKPTGNLVVFEVEHNLALILRTYV